MYIIKFNNNILHNVNYFFVALRFQNRITRSQLNIMTTHKSKKKKKKLLIFTPLKKKEKKKLLIFTLFKKKSSFWYSPLYWFQTVPRRQNLPDHWTLERWKKTTNRIWVITYLSDAYTCNVSTLESEIGPNQRNISLG